MSLSYWHLENLIFKRCLLLPHQAEKEIKGRSWQGSHSQHIPGTTSVFLWPGLPAVFPPPSLQGSMGKPKRKCIFGLMATQTKARPFSFVQFCFSLPVIQSEPWTHASRSNPQDFEHCLHFNCYSKQNVSEKNSLWVVIVLAWVWDAFSSYVKSFTESTYRKPFSECGYLTFPFRSKCFLAKQAKQKAYHLI